MQGGEKLYFIESTGGGATDLFSTKAFIHAMYLYYTKTSLDVRSSSIPFRISVAQEGVHGPRRHRKGSLNWDVNAYERWLLCCSCPGMRIPR